MIGEKRREGGERAGITSGHKGGAKEGGRANTGQARADQLRNSIKVGHVSKCGAIPDVFNFLVKARKLPVSQLVSLTPSLPPPAVLNSMSTARQRVFNHPRALFVLVASSSFISYSSPGLPLISA